MLKPKIKFETISLFPEVFEGYCHASILGRAAAKGLLSFKFHQLRNWSVGKQHHVDDSPYGGGPGMVMRVEPFDQALKSLKVKPRSKTTRIILFSAKGKPFIAQDAVRLSKYKKLVLLCGRYEGVDERVAEHLVDEEISIGPYVLTGGELPAMVVIDAVSRQIPGVLGKEESLATESHTRPGILEAPQYTRPEVYKKWKVPEVLLSGDHKKIEAWRKGYKHNNPS